MIIFLSLSAETLLREEVREWAALKSRDGDLPYDSTLSCLNDSGKSFKEIAQVISENVSEL